MADHDAMEIAEELVAAFNVSGWERFTATLADDVEYTEAGTGRQVHGVESYLELAKSWKVAFPDASGTINTAIGSGSTVAQAVTWTGTHNGPLEGPGATVGASGQPVSVVASLWYRCEGGKVKEVQHHLDVLSLLLQIGALPAPTTG